MVAHLKWGGDRNTLLILYRAIVRSKLDYGFIVYGTASNTNLRQLNSIHNSGLRFALGAFYTSPVSSVYTEANEAPLEERPLKLSMHYYLKSRAFINNPAHHALHEFDQITRDLYIHRYNGRGGMTRPLTPPVGLKVETAMTSAVINSADGSKKNERVGAAAVVNRHFQNGETTCPHLSKRMTDNSTIFATEATAITLALDYYWHMDPVHHDIVVYTDWVSCLQAIEGEDSENPLICHILNLLWLLSDKGTHVRFCWIPSNCGIEGNKRVDQLAKETLDHDIDLLTSVHYADLKPLVNSYIQQWSVTVHGKWSVAVHGKWSVAVHGRDLYLLKLTLGPHKIWKHLTGVEEVVIT